MIHNFPTATLSRDVRGGPTGHPPRPGHPSVVVAAGLAGGSDNGDRDTRDTGAYLSNPAWTDIVRHTLVKGRASVDDPDLNQYWAGRRRRVKPPLDSYTVRLLSKQDA